MRNQQQVRNNLRALGFRIAIGLAIIGGLSGYWSFTVSATSNPLAWWGNWLQDVGTEMLGAAVTILLVELVIYQKRNEASRISQTRSRRREHLTEQLKRARSLSLKQKIIDRIAEQGLLTGAWLYDIDLRQLELDNYNLAEADLYESDLSVASLAKADLTNATLRRANLSQTNLVSAKLEGADLVEADLAGADLYKANLKDADLSAARFSTKTRLPDGTYWSPEMQLDIFVDHLETA
ncbi:MAG: pentapeptide repeat-containing protein [Leptolyngbyaceae cyanobacterium]